MDTGALGGLCCGSRDQILETDLPFPQGRTQESDWEQTVQAIPGADLGEEVLIHDPLQNFIEW